MTYLVILGAIGFAAALLILCSPGEPCPRCGKRRLRPAAECARGTWMVCDSCEHSIWRAM